MYNKSADKIHEKERPCTSDLLYNENNLISKLYRYFCAYFETFSVPTIETRFLLVLSVRYTGISCLESRKSHWMPFIMPAPTRKLMIPGS